ncbi:hypothetical protein CEXT_651251 [Caerostris extrusa]|uniref:Uncharacterized protein n=1 Tax=Caerostris extrusa TaxID=172846 RepID=A0AAV4T720_CAEEX|nr:hypothetical protein CEXT_651251 [Caerostris extrusa]
MTSNFKCWKDCGGKVRKRHRVLSHWPDVISDQSGQNWFIPYNRQCSLNGGRFLLRGEITMPSMGPLNDASILTSTICLERERSRRVGGVETRDKTAGVVQSPSGEDF